MSSQPGPIRNTDKARNLAVAVDGRLSANEMEEALREVSAAMGLVISHITTLSTKKYPGNRHWHLKQDAKTKGCLDVTYWPDGAPERDTSPRRSHSVSDAKRTVMWVTIRNYEPEWVHKQGVLLGPALEKYLA